MGTLYGRSPHRAGPSTTKNRVRGSDVRVAFVPSFPSSGSSLLIRAARRRLSLLLPGAFMLSLWQVCEALVPVAIGIVVRSEEHTSELQSRFDLVCGLL